MFRIQRLSGAPAPEQQALVTSAQAIIRARLPGMPEEEIAGRLELLGNPLDKRFVAELLVAENDRGVVGAAWLLFAPEEGFAWLDAIAVASKRSGGGVGAALYERAREIARAMHGDRVEGGLYFECAPDEPELSPDRKQREANAKRLAFYARFDAHPVIGTAYETPLTEGDPDPPYLMFDGLGRFSLPDPRGLKEAIRAVLERKYRGLCPPAYVEKVVGSVKRGGYALRLSRPAVEKPAPAAALGAAIPLVVNEGHEIHHVREKGYVEAPVRIASILSAIEETGLFQRTAAQAFADDHLEAVHDAGLIDYVRRVCERAPEGRSIYPYVFPIRNAARPPEDDARRAGYWCIDTFTPLNRNAYPAARKAVDCALTAARLVREGAPAAYALVRPPGHHAERRAFGGFCYFNNAAVAAQFLAQDGRVALLDIDYHHGNGAQDIFYQRDDVLTVSIHGDPSIAYPYFSGFADERGDGPGLGFNLNLPLPEETTPERYRETLAIALEAVTTFAPAFLVLAIGFDTGKGDPTGSWSHTPADFELIGRRIGAIGAPTAIVQEGGYRVATLGRNASAFFAGFAAGLATAPAPRRRGGGAPPKKAAEAGPDAAAAGVVYRTTLTPDDAAAIERLAAAAEAFSPAEIALARELAEERLQRGPSSGYEFILAERAGKLGGYACWGPTPCTDHRFDLYWIAVDPSLRRLGIGAALMRRSETAIAALGGKRIYIETSSTPPYERARAFYARMGYAQIAALPDFYRAGDGKIVFSKDLSAM